MNGSGITKVTLSNIERLYRYGPRTIYYRFTNGQVVSVMLLPIIRTKVDYEVHLHQLAYRVGIT